MKKLAHVVLLEKLHAAIDMLLEELDQETPDEGMVLKLETQIATYCELLGEMKMVDSDVEIVAKELRLMSDSLDDNEYFADMKAMLANTAAMVMPATGEEEVAVEETGEGDGTGETDGEVLPEEDLGDGTGEGNDDGTTGGGEEEVAVEETGEGDDEKSTT